jgi:hypothetical protein
MFSNKNKKPRMLCLHSIPLSCIGQTHTYMQEESIGAFHSWTRLSHCAEEIPCGVFRGIK